MLKGTDEKKTNEKRTRSLYYREYALKKKFGLSLDDYQRLLELQDGNCAICGINQSDIAKALDVDHDHMNGNIRGLLCSRCNLGLGYLRDNCDILMAAVAYLRKNGIWGLDNDSS